MQTVSVPVTIVPGTGAEKPKLAMQQLQWPARCACCGGPTGGATIDLRHDVHATGAGIVQEVITTGIPIFPLAWRLPCCPSCSKHPSDPTGISGGVLFLGAFLLWAGIGFLLFLAGLAYNTVAIVVWVALGLGLGYGVLKLYPAIDNLLKQRASSFMKPTCTARGLPVSIDSNLTRIQFAFANDSYADEFRKLNQV